MKIIGLHGAARAGKDTIADFLVRHYGYIKFAFSDALYREVASAYCLPDESLLRGLATKDVPTRRLSLNHCIDGGFRDIARNMVRDDLFRIDPPDWVGLSPRWVLQRWGTEYRRAKDPDYWIKRADLFMEAYINTLKCTITQEEHDELVMSRAKELAAEAPANSIEKHGILVEPAREIYGYGSVFSNPLAKHIDRAKLEVSQPGDEYYADHPGVVVVGVRFPNEHAWVKSYNGAMWHVTRPDNRINLYLHSSEEQFPLRTGDKLIQNNSTIERLHTGVVLALLGNDVVNTTEE